MVAMMNKGVTPVVPEYGSLGASGDLVPSAHMALTMIGEGEALRKGKMMESGREKYTCSRAFLGPPPATVTPTFLEIRDNTCEVRSMNSGTSVMPWSDS
jgi:hypothetical protein